MTLLDFRYKGGRSVLADSRIRGRRLLGRGHFAAVFCNGKSVLKLTACEKSYGFYTSGICNPHFPVTLRDHGQIGKVGPLPVFLIEQERLKPLKRGTDPHRKIVRLVWDYQQAFLTTEETSEECNHTDLSEKSGTALLKLSDEESLSVPFRLGLLDLAEFAIENYCAADFHDENFMLRDNQIVFNDPVVNYRAMGYC